MWSACLPWAGSAGSVGGEGKECPIEAGGGGVLRRSSEDEAVGGLGVKRKDPRKTVWRESGACRKERREGEVLGLETWKTWSI